jgi:hypothetical protein
MIAVKCPKCELRFGSQNELAWHLREDHRRSKGLGLPDRWCRPRGGRRSQRKWVTGSTS